MPWEGRPGPNGTPTVTVTGPPRFDEVFVPYMVSVDRM
ncbi:hypothetical protein EYZ11_006001 [Aspergillus tanneri]|uniref:Uncharacterized protein n=1 Tax=Aspergillus tanneri TaxID=1220188 RepID=A0A4S3JGK3_9EURO|nr:hypothetical protein EYZ11_006001 [Aspergillus tanneri]